MWEDKPMDARLLKACLDPAFIELIPYVVVNRPRFIRGLSAGALFGALCRDLEESEQL
jgi:hypothetical protein